MDERSFFFYKDTCCSTLIHANACAQMSVRENTRVKVFCSQIIRQMWAHIIKFEDANWNFDFFIIFCAKKREAVRIVKKTRRAHCTSAKITDIRSILGSGCV